MSSALQTLKSTLRYAPSTDALAALHIVDADLDQTTRIPTKAVRHKCACGQLIGIQVNHRMVIKHRGARGIPGGGARVTCDRCKRLTSFTSFEITMP
jgi:hypothetical protein